MSKFLPISGFKWIDSKVDANNLYGYAMSKFFPISGLKWIDPKEFEWNKYTNIV